MNLQLARNSAKFVQKGYIRLRAEVVDGSVVICIEDSGPGIPEEKRMQLFARFQESLDTLSQGTGIGLSLCKRLSALLGAEISLDESFDSGISGCPGTKFVIKLHQPPVHLEERDFRTTDDATFEQSPMRLISKNSVKDLYQHGSSASASIDDTQQTTNPPDEEPEQDLPADLRVLFVDDDMILRKLFCRSVKKCAPTWTVKEAASGESALKLVGESEEDFDIIFLDQYMTSVEKQLLGTETAAALRARGVKCVMCGLSANDKANEFFDSGADAFIMKPLPCKQSELKDELLRVIDAGRLMERREKKVPEQVCKRMGPAFAVDAH